MKTFDAQRHCGAQTNERWNDGVPCKQPKGFRTDHAGTGHCWLHGGSSPNGKRHAQHEAAQKALGKLGVPVGNGDPFTLLAKAVSHAEGYLEATAQVLRDAAEASDAQGEGPAVIQEPEPQRRFQARTEHQALDVAAELYEQAIRTAARTGKAAVDADVADRLAALDERAGALLLRFIRELLAKAVPANKRPALEAWASGRLAELAAEYEQPVAVH